MRGSVDAAGECALWAWPMDTLSLKFSHFLCQFTVTSATTLSLQQALTLDCVLRLIQGTWLYSNHYIW